jgi:hypothetical protein
VSQKSQNSLSAFWHIVNKCFPQLLCAQNKVANIKGIEYNSISSSHFKQAPNKSMLINKKDKTKISLFGEMIYRILLN